MKIYFEDGQLHNTIPKEYGEETVRIDAANGPTVCINELGFYTRHKPNCSIYTNYLGAMSFDYSWNKEENKCDCYIRNKNNDWTNLQDLTNRQLRFARNIPKMYLAGEFN